MFKKTPTIKPLAPLRSSDRRKLAEQIIHDFNLDSPTTQNTDNEQTPEQKAEATAARTALRNSLLPDNTQSARFTTTQGPDLKQASGTVYVGSYGGEEGRILWFQIEGRTYPSVYTLWRHPDLVPLLHTPDIVVQKLKGGADLMTPGLAGGPPFPEKAVKGATVAVASTDNPSVPVMVGWCEIDVAGLKEVRGARGHAVRNMHWAGDEVWSFGANGRAGQAAPESIGGWERVLERRGLTEKVDALDLEDGDDGGVAIEDGETNGGLSHHHQHNPHVDGESIPDANAPTSKELSQKEIDAAFRNAFLYGIHKHKNDRGASPPSYGLTFPLTQSFIMSNMIQPFLPTFTPEDEKQLQIKKTSWKNIKKFVKYLDKEQIVKCKEKDGHEIVILDIDFDDRAVLEFQPYRLPKKETAGGAAQGRGEQATSQIDSTADPSIGQKLQVKTFYKPTTKLSPLFATSDKSLFTPPEVRELITTYIDSAALVSESNKRLVKLDPTLANAVFDGSGTLDKEVLAKGTVPRDALVDRVLGAMSTAYTIQKVGDNNNDGSGSAAKPKSGLPPKVKITLETRSGNKTVTKVSGLEVYSIAPRLLAEELRKACAGSTSVEALAGAAKKHERVVEEVMVQGPQREAVVKALAKRGVEGRWVEVVDKTKGKGKGR